MSVRMYMGLKYSHKQEGNRRSQKQGRKKVGVSIVGRRGIKARGSSAVGPVKTLPQSNK